MLSSKQKHWLAQLSDTDKVKIVPYNPKTKDVFKKQERLIQSALGKESVVLHEGASAWGISGKGDVDIYIPVKVKSFNKVYEKLRSLLGDPGSYYQDERVRWNKVDDAIDVEIFLVNKEADFWKESIIFWDYIKSHHEALEKYRELKEKANGSSTRKYYTKKIEFYNEILNTKTSPKLSLRQSSRKNRPNG